MKTKLSQLLLILFMGLTFYSCDLSSPAPAPPIEVQLRENLPRVQHFLSYWSGSDINRFQLIWMQQQSGIRGAHLQVDKYIMAPNYLDDEWTYYYGNVYLGNLNIIGNASEIDAFAYRGMARIMQAYGLGFMTDTWGSVPYHDGLKYFSGGLPEYEPQSDLYLLIFELLNTGIEDLDLAIAGQGIKPDAETDFIYGGDLEKWRRAAHVMKMRFNLRLAKPTGDYQAIADLAQSGNVFTGIQDDMIFPFNPALGIQNPHYYNDQIIRNTRMGKFFVDRLLETNDPRMVVFARRNASNLYLGTAPAEGLVNASFIGTAMASAGSDISLITYTEQKFIEAEIYHRTQMPAQADQAYQQAVKSSLSFHGVSNAQWEAEHAEVENVDLEQIINAKYIALFLQAEVWSDFRRTGFPVLTPYEGETSKIPRHFIYPLDEITRNLTNVPPDVDIYTRMWWDFEVTK